MERALACWLPRQPAGPTLTLPVVRLHGNQKGPLVVALGLPGERPADAQVPQPQQHPGEVRAALPAGQPREQLHGLQEVVLRQPAGAGLQTQSPEVGQDHRLVPRAAQAPGRCQGAGVALSRLPGPAGPLQGDGRHVGDQALLVRGGHRRRQDRL